LEGGHDEFGKSGFTSKQPGREQTVINKLRTYDWDDGRVERCKDEEVDRDLVLSVSRLSDRAQN
jgi:hypothetical protein